MEIELVSIVLIIVFGALAGGLTNTIAIWMLFHPYHAPKLFGRWRIPLQGAIPKNQPRLAAAIGKTVGNRLLPPEDLAETFADEKFRGAFDDRLSDFIQMTLHTERGSLRELIPEPVMADLEMFIEDGIAKGVDQLDEYLQSESFEESMGRRAVDLIEAVKDEPIGAILTAARGTAMESAVDDWLHNAVESEDFTGAIEDYLDRAAARMLAPGRTFEEILPLGLVGLVEKGIADYLPLAAQRLGGLLDDEAARARVEAMLHDLLHRFQSDLKFHQKIVARLVMTEETVDKVLDTFQAEGSERLSEILRDSAVQEAMSRGVNEAIVDFLRRPVAEVFGEPGDPNVIESRDTLAGWIVGMAQDESTREFLVEKLHTGLEKAGDKTWGQVLERVPIERVSEALVSAARSDAARDAMAAGITKSIQSLLDRPIGTPARWLPEDGAAKLEAAVGDPIWSWIQGQVPAVVEQLDIAQRVEEKVLHFPMPRMEEIVRNVTDRELKLIVKIGYALGAFVGVVMVAVNFAVSYFLTP